MGLRNCIRLGAELDMAPSSASMGVCSPMCPEAEASPFGASLTASGFSPGLGILRDDASAPSVSLGEEAVGRVSLSIASGSSASSEDKDCSRLD